MAKPKQHVFGDFRSLRDSLFPRGKEKLPEKQVEKKPKLVKPDERMSVGEFFSQNLTAKTRHEFGQTGSRILEFLSKPQNFNALERMVDSGTESAEKIMDQLEHFLDSWRSIFTTRELSLLRKHAVRYERKKITIKDAERGLRAAGCDEEQIQLMLGLERLNRIYYRFYYRDRKMRGY